MSSPAVGQLQLLAELFREALSACRPGTVAVPGCATGNGMEHVDPAVTRRIVGVDIHPRYLLEARHRFVHRLPGLVLVCADLESFECRPESFDLVFLGLVLEYVDPAVTVSRAASWVGPGGVLAVVLQLPSPTSGKVTPTVFHSLRRLDAVMHLVHPEVVTSAATGEGLEPRLARVDSTAAGKRFHVAHFVRPPAGPPRPAAATHGGRGNEPTRRP